MGELGLDIRSIKIGYRQYGGLSAEVGQGANLVMMDKVCHILLLLDHSDNVAGCHAERSEASLRRRDPSPSFYENASRLPNEEILRCAQDDRSPVFVH